MEFALLLTAAFGQSFQGITDERVYLAELHGAHVAHGQAIKAATDKYRHAIQERIDKAPTPAIRAAYQAKLDALPTDTMPTITKSDITKGIWHSGRAGYGSLQAQTFASPNNGRNAFDDKARFVRWRFRHGVLYAAEADGTTRRFQPVTIQVLREVTSAKKPYWLIRLPD